MRDLVVTLAVFGILPFVFKSPWVGTLVWSWLGYMNPHRLTYGFAYNMPFAAVTAGVTLIGFFLTKEKRSFPITPLTTVWVIFLLWMCVTTLFALNQDSAVEVFKKVFKIQLMTAVTIMLIINRERLNALVWVIVLSLGFYGIKGGIFTIATAGQFRVWGPTGSYIEGNNELALALIVILPLMRYLQEQATNKWVRWGLYFALATTALSIISSYSRGALLASVMMGLFLWLKSRRKLLIGFFLVLAAAVTLNFMPQKWFDRMDTINTYEEDLSAMSRINAWKFAYTLALDRPIVGGGFETFTQELFYKYSENPEIYQDAHSIYFEILGEQGFVGLFLFLLLWYMTYRTANVIKAKTKDVADLAWAANLVSMVQVSLVGYCVGGAFLGLAYFDLPYHLMAIVVIVSFIVEDKLKEADKAKEEITQQKPSSVYYS